MEKLERLFMLHSMEGISGGKLGFLCVYMSAGIPNCAALLYLLWSAPLWHHLLVLTLTCWFAGARSDYIWSAEEHNLVLHPVRVPAYLPVTTKLQTKKISLYKTDTQTFWIAVDCDADNSIKILQKVLTASYTQSRGPVKVLNIVWSGLADIRFSVPGCKNIGVCGDWLAFGPRLKWSLEETIWHFCSGFILQPEQTSHTRLCKSWL